MSFVYSNAIRFFFLKRSNAMGRTHHKDEKDTCYTYIQNIHAIHILKNIHAIHINIQEKTKNRPCEEN